MTTKKKIIIKDPDLAKVDVALRRAAQKARQKARETNTNSFKVVLLFASLGSYFVHAPWHVTFHK